MGDIIRFVFDFFNTVEVMGLNLTTWLIICLVLSGITLFVRGNK